MKRMNFSVCPRAHIVFAILDVVKTDFPHLYNDSVHPDMFVNFHYPGYRYIGSSSIMKTLTQRNLL